MVQEINETAGLDEINFDIDSVSGVSSAPLLKAFSEATSSAASVARAFAAEEMSPIFRELATPTLPELPRQARARLLMQSPTRLYFYWSVGPNPYGLLGKALGSDSGYRLAMRLLDLTLGTENLHAVEQEGSWWFDVRPNTEYRAEIGFYSPSRPFVRILFSNTVTTPRKGPSPHRSSEARWVISTGRFADLLEASGFSSDAAGVASADEFVGFAGRLAEHLGAEPDVFSAMNDEVLRQVVEDLAAGTPIVDFKWKVSAELYALIEEHLARLSASALRETLAIDEEADRTTAAIGGSLVNIRKPRYRPISSHSLR